MLYTIGDAAEGGLGIPASALRYYDKEGLLPHMNRSGSGIRMFTEDDFEWVRFIERLKKSGMPIKEIKSYIDLYEQGDGTIGERRELIYARPRRRRARDGGVAGDARFHHLQMLVLRQGARVGLGGGREGHPGGEYQDDIRAIKERCGVSKY